jgi:Putative metallopeptidase
MWHRPAALALFALLLAQPAAVAQPAPPAAQAPAASKAELEKRVLDIVEMFQNDPRYNKGKTPSQIKDSVEFVTGNVLFVLGHETAHALISEFGIPVLGREEDAADALATIVSLKMSTAFADRVVYNAARGWFLGDQRDRKEGIPLTFYDEHGMDLQRAYNIVCLMVGGAPDKFEKLANEVKLPEERQDTCQGDFSNASWSWEQVLKPHMRKPEDPKTEIPVNYAPTKEYAILSDLGQKLRILEVVAGWLSRDFVWKKPIGLEMQECGSPNARWDLQSKKVIVCYELIREFVQLYRGYGQEALVPGPMMVSKNKKVVPATAFRKPRAQKGYRAKGP